MVVRGLSARTARRIVWPDAEVSKSEAAFSLRSSAHCASSTTGFWPGG